LIYLFNQYQLDTEQYQLSLSGQPVAMEPLVFDLLVYLIEHRDRVVSRDELLEKLWKGKVVTDAALGARLKDVRKATGDSGSKQAVIKTLHGRGYQFVAEIVDSDGGQQTSKQQAGSTIGLKDQSPVRYCQSRDGVSLAHCEVGSGNPLVITGSWMSHLEEDWNSPAWKHYLSQLAQNYQLIRYDQRGNGMSDWDNVDISFEPMVDDLEAIIDYYGHDKVAIFGPSQAAAVSIAYACRYPERVSHLILHGGYSRGRCHRGDPNGPAESQAFVTLIRQSWANDNPMIRQAFTSMMMPDATREEADWFNEYQKTSGPGENMARFREMFDDMDVSGLLPQVKAPTLVIQSDRDSIAPLSEGKLLASRIPDAKFVTLNSRNHMLFEHEPEFSRFLSSVRDFLNDAGP
jgi:pimeloyl-ACP methyl ester carboxylesterase